MCHRRPEPLPNLATFAKADRGGTYKSDQIDAVTAEHSSIGPHMALRFLPNAPRSLDRSFLRLHFLSIFPSRLGKTFSTMRGRLRDLARVNLHPLNRHEFVNEHVKDDVMPCENSWQYRRLDAIWINKGSHFLKAATAFVSHVRTLPPHKRLNRRPAPASYRFIAFLWPLCRIPHKLHTTATHMLTAGIDIASISPWLGHEFIQSTSGHLNADMPI